MSDDQYYTSDGTEYPYLFRWLHWLMTGSLVVLVLTGISQYASAPAEWSLFGGKMPGWMWLGRVHLFHDWASLVFLPSAIAAGLMYMKWRVALRVSLVILLIASALAAVSGLLMIYPVGPEWLYPAARWTHQVVGLIVLPLSFLWHVFRGFSKFVFALVPSFNPISHPSCCQLVAFVPLAALCTWVLCDFWPWRLPCRDLVAVRIAVPAADGQRDLTALPWSDAGPVVIEMISGANFDRGRTRMTLRALHDGERLYLLAQWDDPTQSLEYWPWEKTEDGWKHYVDSKKDETVYYEDKFSLLFPIRQEAAFDAFGCATSCHVDGGYGWGYKGYGTAEDPRWLDVWHWKAARTDPVDQVDDKYWAEVDFDNKDVGRWGDPDDGGGYTKNVDEDESRPPFLPDPKKEPGLICRNGPEGASHKLNLVPFSSYIPQAHAVEYSEEAAAKIRVGAKVPGIVVDAFVGDRADVRCTSQYADGQWNLFIQRKLDTGSPYDVQFAPGGAYSFGAAAFDHAAKRHAWGPSVYRLVIEP